MQFTVYVKFITANYVIAGWYEKIILLSMSCTLWNWLLVSEPANEFGEIFDCTHEWCMHVNDACNGG